MITAMVKLYYPPEADMSNRSILTTNINADNRITSSEQASIEGGLQVTLTYNTSNNPWIIESQEILNGVVAGVTYTSSSSVVSEVV